ncbi:MAG: class I tRNA ligase family protein, partial [Anaerolineales bacterium]
IPCPQCQGTMERVKDLIDVWFDSGSMPAAQWHYPFEGEDLFNKQFPADFICEAYDQTRGWFYSLHAISTMLFDQEAYRNVICLGLILDAEGKKMSKSQKNVIDPWEVINTHGSDAFRWYLYTATPPDKDRRFSVELVGGAVRQLTLPLWNVYAFFITHAVLERWTPTPENSSTRSGSNDYTYLDRWLLSELNLLIEEVTSAFEDFNTIQATRPIQKFVEALSRLYLRHSRHRFRRNDNPADKQAAFNTLYKTLVTLSKLLAPAMPLLAEEFYQNLVRGLDQETLPSVHMVDWPRTDWSMIDDVLNQEMQLLMKLLTLGHSARNQAGIKVRQPLSEIIFSVQNKSEQLTIDQQKNLLTKELNVKTVRSLNTTEEFFSYILNPLPAKLGSKYKALYPSIKQAIHDLNPEKVASNLMDGIPIEVTVGDQNYVIQADEVEIQTQPLSSMVVARDGPYFAVLNTELTPNLISEGIIRELIRHIQSLRKQADLEFNDHIQIYFQTTPSISEIFQEYRDYILKETRATAMIKAAPPDESITMTTRFDNELSVLGLMEAPEK